MTEDELQSRYQALLPPDLRLIERDGQDVRFGDVYLADDAQAGLAAGIRRRVRFLPPDDAETPGAWETWPKWRERFLERLAKFVGLQLPHVASTLDVRSGLSEIVWVVMPYHKQSLIEWAEAAQRTPAELADVLAQLLEGLAALHARGLAHGDIRPQNLSVDSGGLDSDIPRTCLPSAWVGDPVIGLLQICSHNLLHDHKRDAYYDAARGAADCDSELMRADLYALARVACELGLPLNVLAQFDHTPAALWQACRRALERGDSAEPAWRRCPKRLVVGDDRDRRRLTATVAVLLGERPGNWASRWLTSWSAGGTATDAGQVVARLRKHWRDREAIRRVAMVAALLLLAIAAVWGLASRRGLDAELAKEKEAHSTVQTQLDQTKAHVSEIQSSNDGLQERLKQKASNDLAAELRTINGQLNQLAAAVKRIPKPGPERPVKRDPAEVALAKAKADWREKFGEKPYDKNQAKKLFEKVSQEDKTAANGIRDWKQGPKGDGGLDELLRLSKPWIDAKTDGELVTLCNEAGREPWNKLDEARRRVDNLRAAARLWERCANPSVSPQGLIANEPDPEVRAIASAWYQRLLAPKWTLQLIEGITGLGADYDDKERMVTLYAGSTVTGEKHEWPPDSRRPPAYKQRYQYRRNDSPNGRLAFDWRSDSGQTIQFYLERGWSWYTGGIRPNLIAGNVFDGPLALWKFNNAAIAKSSDGKTTLSYYVIGCPGPPSNWDVPAAVAKKAKAPLKNAKSGGAAK